MANIIRGGLPFMLVQILFISFAVAQKIYLVTSLELVHLMVYISGGIGLLFAAATIFNTKESFVSAMFSSYASSLSILAAILVYKGGPFNIYWAGAAALGVYLTASGAYRYNSLIKSLLRELATPISLGIATYFYLEGFTRGEGLVNDFMLCALVFIPACITAGMALVQYEFQSELKKRTASISK